ncbi:hypothetical protein GCM10023080_027340 [Streptomyces pseudoechinosporeus]
MTTEPDPMPGRPGRHDYCPWEYFGSATAEERATQSAWQKQLSLLCGELDLQGDVYVSPSAGVHADRLHLGNRSYIAAHAYVTDELTAGRDCTVNPYAVVRGRVRMGNAVRLGAHSSLLGFNHSMAPDLPVHKQPLTSAGIEIGDDVWIGSHVVVCDGVTIGDHCVIGAGAVVTKDLPPWSVAAGNPARRLRDRRDTPTASAPARGGTTLEARLERFGERAREQAADVLDRCLTQDADGVPRYTDRPGKPITVRAQCDAAEIAALLLDAPPPGVGEPAAALRELQDPRTGLVPEFGAAPASLDDDAALYHILCVGYALQLLGTGFAHPVHAVHELGPEQLTARLDALPWPEQAWRCGHWVDGVSTAMWINSQHFGLSSPTVDTLFGWMLTHADPVHGLWGAPRAKDRWLQPVNGFYRLTRGTFAQYGLPLPYPERTVDTVLTHSTDPAFFGTDRGNACNVLDVIHPLSLCARQTTHRIEAGRDWARRQLERVLGVGWQDGAGCSFALTPGTEPGLQGTEMWLAITWLLAEHLGLSGALDYRPKGVHCPEPAA